MRVCSLHFNENDFFTVRHRKNLKKNAVPSLNLPQVVHGSSSSSQFSSKTTLASARGERLAMRTKVKEEIGIPISENLCEVEIEDEKIVECLNESEIEAANTLLSLMQTDVENSNQKTFRDFEVQVNMPRKYTLCDFITSDASLTSLTGIRSHQLLNKIVSNVELVYNDKRLHKLTLYQRIILTLVKMKWNLSYTILSIFFGLSPTLSRTYVVQMIKILSIVLRTTIEIPSMEEITQNMPIYFADFQDTQVILDCTEIFTEKPKCLCCRVRFYSHYKSTQTIKFMTGVSPAGLITFVSKAYGGRASDKIIFEKSELIEKLEVNSAVMVDKGFLIDDICKKNNIKLYRPPFLRHKKQLSKNEAQYNAKIAAARVHIERTYQRIKTFKILGGKLPWSHVPYVEDIFIIACGITNLSAPILGEDKFIH